MAQVCLIIVFLTLGFTLSLVRPYTAGPDEVAHFKIINFIARHHRLPITWEERSVAGYKSDWPPLYYLLVGAAGSGIDLDSPPFIKVTHDNPRLKLVVGLKNIVSWRALTTEDPYQGEVLLWYLGRWITLLCGAVGVGATYLLVHICYPNNPYLALSAATLLAFIPTYINISSVISYEPLLGALLAFYFVLLFYTIKYPNQNWFYFGLSLLMGTAILTKYTPLPTLPILPLLVIWLAYRNRCGWRIAFWRLVLIGLGLATTFGSWVLFTEVYFNQVTKSGWIFGLLRPFVDEADSPSVRIMDVFSGAGLNGLISPDGQGTSFLEWFWHVYSGVWGAPWLTWVFSGLLGISLVGLVRRWRHEDQQMRLWILLLGAHIILFSFLLFIRFFITRDIFSAFGHHILFPAGAAMIILLVLGLNTWLSPAYLTKLFIVIVSLCLCQVIIPVAQSSVYFWPIRTVPFSKNEQVLATFGNLSLIHYEPVANNQILEITLQWRAEALFDEDYWIEMMVLDANNQVRVRWLGQPLNGSYPTRAWAPGDRVRDTIYLPIAGLSPNSYRVQLRLLSQSFSIDPSFHPAIQSSFLPIAPTYIIRDNTHLISTGVNYSLDLGYVTLAPSTALVTDTLFLNNQRIGYTLWLQNLPATDIPVYKERSTIVISTNELVGNEVRLSLVGPDGQSREPIDHTGYVYSFYVAPHFASGEYRLRFEQWSGSNLINQVETPAIVRIETEARQFEVSSISHPVMANFSGQVALLGYDLPQRQVQPGGRLLVVLYWQALKTIGSDMITFNRLINKNKEVGGGKDRQIREVYSTILWAPGEIVADPFELEVNTAASLGIYNLLVGLYLQQDKTATSLPLLENGQRTDITSVSIGPIKVGSTLPGLTVESATPQVILNQPFGDAPNLTLLGYNLTDETGQPITKLPISNLHLTLYWRSESPLPLDYTTFVHLDNAAGETVAQKDQPPLGGAYPTSLWDPGEIIADLVNVPLPANLPSGEYQLVIGMYNLGTGTRLTVPGSAANSLLLRKVMISP